MLDARALLFIRKILTESCHNLLPPFCFQRIFNAKKKQHQQQTCRQVNLQIEYDDKKFVIFDETLSTWMSHPVESSICIFKQFHGLSIDSKTVWKRPFLWYHKPNFFQHLQNMDMKQLN